MLAQQDLVAERRNNSIGRPSPRDAEVMLERNQMASFSSLSRVASSDA